MQLSQDKNLLAVMKQRRLMRCLCHRNCFAVDICHSQIFLGSTVQSSWSQGFLNPTETCCRMFQIRESIHHKSFACPGRHRQTSMPRAILNSVLPLYRMPIYSNTPTPLRVPHYTCKAIPVQALRLPGGWGSQISWQSAHEVVMLSAYAQAAFTPAGNVHGTYFC